MATVAWAGFWATMAAMQTISTAYHSGFSKA